jgi:hypothetical protein
MIKQTMLPFKLKMSKEDITARSGLALYAEFLRAIGLKRMVQRHMPTAGSNRGYGAWQFIEPLMLMLYGGGRHVEDVREIAEDKALRRLIGLRRMPSCSTLGDWLRRMAQVGLRVLSAINSWMVRQMLRRDNREAYTLWVDSTLIEAEKREAIMTYKGFKGYHPLLAGLKELPLILHGEFRPGNAGAGSKAVAFLKQCLRVLPEGKRIEHLSSDSALYQAEVINWCRRNKISFTVAADQDSAVKQAMGGIAEGDWKPLRDKEGVESDREVAETVHCMNATEEAFRLVVVRWMNLQKNLFKPETYGYHVIATDLEAEAEQVVWHYNSRAQMENYIKELKSGFGMEQMPSGDFKANALWFALGVMVYNTSIWQKLSLLPEGWHHKTIHTLRWALIEIPGKLISHGRSLILKLATTEEKFQLYLMMRHCCLEFT